MATTWVDFRQIKTDVGIERVLERYGARLRRVGDELRGPHVRGPGNAIPC